MTVLVAQARMKLRVGAMASRWSWLDRWERLRIAANSLSLAGLERRPWRAR